MCIGCVLGGAGRYSEDLVEILLYACVRVEDGVGLWGEFDGVGRFFIGEVGDGHAACGESVALVLLFLQLHWISV